MPSPEGRVIFDHRQNAEMGKFEQSRSVPGTGDVLRRLDLNTAILDLPATSYTYIEGTT